MRVLGDGRGVSFRYGKLVGEETLATKFPRLFSNSLQKINKLAEMAAWTANLNQQFRRHLQWILPSKTKSDEWGWGQGQTNDYVVREVYENMHVEIDFVKGKFYIQMWKVKVTSKVRLGASCGDYTTIGSKQRPICTNKTFFQVVVTQIASFATRQ
ncbi:hypothetical protein JHK84_055143 [Glycine max]|uniref:Uncharacterized protein n=1 Tax=Glycine max TaxID=3847 RepID=A0A0R0EHX2_SOYBN|nr:hypothetical protein JHK85_056092 [Glycine max]KAG5073912.1 hypothetical protein JHK84_055143 [Glycine max]KAH1034490.1 hypothetical protein GYH30_054769 [Glycine max]